MGSSQLEGEMQEEQKEEERKEVAIESEESDGMGMMNCPVCTYLNPTTNVNCEVCEESLR